MSKTKHAEQQDSTSSDTQLEDDDADQPPDFDLSLVTDEPAGLTAEGEWAQIVRFCEYFDSRLQRESVEVEIDADNLQEWQDWYPKEQEDQQQLRERTVSHASYEPGLTPEEQLEKSASRLSSSRENLQSGQPEEAIQELVTGTQNGLLGLLVLVGMVAGNVESFIYQFFMVKTNPSYFDNHLLSANVQQVTEATSQDSPHYKIQIKVHDQDLRDRLSRRIG